jgi:hypothetical protein
VLAHSLGDDAPLLFVTILYMIMLGGLQACWVETMAPAQRRATDNDGTSSRKSHAE